MKIKFTREAGGNEVGAIVDLPQSQAQFLVASGYAETVAEPKRRPAKGAGTPPPPSAR